MTAALVVGCQLGQYYFGANMMAHDDESNPRLKVSIHDGIRKDPQRKYTATLRGGCANAWMLDQKLGNTLELGEEPMCYE